MMPPRDQPFQRSSPKTTEPHPLDVPMPREMLETGGPPAVAPLKPGEADEIAPLDRGEDLELSEPPQFSIKKALLAMSGASIWLAAMQSDKLRGPCSIVSLIAICYLSGTILHFVETRIKQFAAAGVWPICSGLLAAGCGSVGALCYGTLLSESFTYSFGFSARYVVAMLCALLTALALTSVAVVVVMLLMVITLIESFRRRYRDLPMLLGTHVVDAALGSFIFLASFLALETLRQDFVSSNAGDWVMAFVGGFMGLIFGSAGVNTHFQLLDDARATAKRIEAQRRFKFSR